MAKFLTGANLFDAKPVENKVTLFSKSTSNISNKDSVYDNYIQIIKEVHLHIPQKLIIGHLISHENCKWVVKIIQNKGKALTTMGYSYNNLNFLLLEEALYLMESASIQVFYGEIPLSVEQMYNVIIDTYDNPNDRYLIYKSLCSRGYIIRLHNCDKLKEITKNYRNPFSRKYIVDCSVIPKFLSSLHSQMDSTHLNKLNMFKNNSNQSFINCQILYDIYSESKSYSKSKEICPDYLLYYSKNGEQIIHENLQCNQFISLLVGIVDEGDVSFVEISKTATPDLKLIR